MGEKGGMCEWQLILLMQPYQGTGISLLACNSFKSSLSHSAGGMGGALLAMARAEAIIYFYAFRELLNAKKPLTTRQRLLIY